MDENSSAGQLARLGKFLNEMCPILNQGGKLSLSGERGSSIVTSRPFFIVAHLKVHKIEIFFGFDFEICIISLLVMSKY